MFGWYTPEGLLLAALVACTAQPALPQECSPDIKAKNPRAYQYRGDRCEGELSAERSFHGRYELDLLFVGFALDPQAVTLPSHVRLAWSTDGSGAPIEVAAFPQRWPTYLMRTMKMGSRKFTWNTALLSTSGFKLSPPDLGFLAAADLDASRPLYLPVFLEDGLSRPTRELIVVVFSPKTLDRVERKLETRSDPPNDWRPGPHLKPQHFHPKSDTITIQLPPLDRDQDYRLTLQGFREGRQGPLRVIHFRYSVPAP